MVCRGCVFGIAVGCAALVSVTVAYGSEPATGETAVATDARTIDAEARALFERGSYADAARAFERAFERAPQAATQYNIALSWDRAHEEARAADAFETALEIPGLDTERTRASEQRLAELRRRLGYVVVRRPLGARISVLQVRSRAIPTAFHLPPGVHHAELVLGDGRVIGEPITVVAGQIVELAADPPSTGLAASPAAPPVHRDTYSVRAAGPSPWPFVAFGAAALCSAAAVVLGVETLRARDDYVANHSADTDVRDGVVRLRNWTNAAWGAAIISAGAGLFLLVAGKTSGSRHPARSTPVSLQF